jgi:signal transduction histidine kinase
MSSPCEEPTVTRSLAFKLILSFLLVSLTGTALLAVFVRRTTTAEFDSYVLEQMRLEFNDQALQYYEAHGSWSGVVEYFQRTDPASQPAPRSPGGGSPQPQTAPRPQNPFVLTDADGRVVLPAGKFLLDERIGRNKLAQGSNLVSNGRVVGTVLTVVSPAARDRREELYVTRTTQAIMLAAIGATAIALLLGVVLARTLTYPLRELTAAAQAMARGDLEQQVPVRSHDEMGEVAIAFNQMSSDLARSNQSRRQMTADIAHELRTPLTVIGGYIESMRDGTLKPTPERLAVMYTEAQRLKRLVEDLRTLSLADAHELVLHRQSTQPQVLLVEAAEAFAPSAAKQNISLDTDADPDLPDISVDPERIAQVLGNLMSNALRHTPSGGKVVLSAQVSSDELVLSVQDTGAGISAQALPHVFERYYREEWSSQEESTGSGLGLAIAKSIVEAHGGAIAAASAGAGKGSTFAIHLPLGT